MDTSELASNAAKNIGQFDETFNTTTSIEPDILTETAEKSKDPIRILPYWLNRNKQATSVKPVFNSKLELNSMDTWKVAIKKF